MPLALIVMPLSLFGFATIFEVPVLTREVLVILAAVPSGAVAAVIAERYGCDGALASMIVVISFLFSLVTITLISVFLL